MPIPCYLSLEGQTQGTIEGSSKVQGHEGKILVQAVEHLVDIPSNPQNGLPSGKCVLGPMTLSKEVDKSSPKLFQALSQGEQMPARPPAGSGGLATGRPGRLARRRRHAPGPRVRGFLGARRAGPAPRGTRISRCLNPGTPRRRSPA